MGHFRPQVSLQDLARYFPSSPPCSRTRASNCSSSSSGRLTSTVKVCMGTSPGLHFLVRRRLPIVAHQAHGIEDARLREEGHGHPRVSDNLGEEIHSAAAQFVGSAPASSVDLWTARALRGASHAQRRRPRPARPSSPDARRRPPLRRRSTARRAGDRFPALLCRTIYNNQHPRYVDGRALRPGRLRGRACRTAAAATTRTACGGPTSASRTTATTRSSGSARSPGATATSARSASRTSGFTQILPAPLRCPLRQGARPDRQPGGQLRPHLRSTACSQLQNAMNFSGSATGRSRRRRRQHVDVEPLYRRLPLISALDELGDRPFYREIVSHPTFDEFWQSYSMKGRYERGRGAGLLHDRLVRQPAPRGVQVLRAAGRAQARTGGARALTRLLVGPWAHSHARQRRVVRRRRLRAAARRWT